MTLVIKVGDRRFAVQPGRAWSAPGTEAPPGSVDEAGAPAPPRSNPTRRPRKGKRGAEHQGGRAKQARGPSSAATSTLGSLTAGAQPPPGLAGFASPWHQGWAHGPIPGPVAYPVAYPSGYLPPASGQQPAWLGPYPLGHPGQAHLALALPAAPLPGTLLPGAPPSPSPPVSSPGQPSPVAPQAGTAAPATPMVAPSPPIAPQTGVIDPASGAQDRGAPGDHGGRAAEATTAEGLPPPSPVAARGGRGGRGRGRGRGRRSAPPAASPAAPAHPESVAAGAPDHGT